ncbi:uncharacterized protein LOC110452661 [Mizuhopecten yessoensis]|uniref:Outer dense fiber protein 3 n=1 Tax=Mizuhopecten yessoensis TaxID=6573 RepID=A0A210QIY3_MIZYE|nr:uncharacterized protein LOC110452661 [Mizuhopecten yessoensis]OWF48748.1 hypothetical protein KP79_PYT11965 [Mizuhopecten yessoensis]
MTNTHKARVNAPIIEDRQWDASPKSQNAEKTKKIPARNAMGEYIVPAGGKALTSLGNPAPGPANYCPHIGLTRSSAPQYSIVGKHRSNNDAGKGIPGPSDYTTTGDLIWKKKNSTLKSRGKSFFDEEAARSCTVIGPAKYNVEHKLGKDGPKYSIAHKQSPVIYTGPPNSKVQPADTHGFQTPGPNYRPNSSYWKRGHEKSFGSARNISYTENPGPGDYCIKDPPAGVSYSFGSKLPPTPSVKRATYTESPGPGTYNLGTTIGKATSVSISGKAKETDLGVFQGPSPATYYLRNSMNFNRKPITLAYRWFGRDEPKTPGPADYSVSKKNLKTNPIYSNRQHTKPSFPDSLNYTSKGEGDLPGPGSYNLSKNFVKNDSPAYSMRQKIRAHETENPAPNSYKAEQNDTVPGGRKAPSFSMGRQFEVPDSKVSPGPAAYTPSLAESTPKYTMTSRPKSNRRGGNPAANAYKVPSAFGQASAATLKSRASPYVYSGFRTTKITEEVPSI